MMFLFQVPPPTEDAITFPAWALKAAGAGLTAVVGAAAGQLIRMWKRAFRKMDKLEKRVDKLYTYFEIVGTPVQGVPIMPRRMRVKPEDVEAMPEYVDPEKS